HEETTMVPQNPRFDDHYAGKLRLNNLQKMPSAVKGHKQRVLTGQSSPRLPLLTELAARQQTLEILPVPSLAQCLGLSGEPFPAQPALAEGNLFQAGHLQPLPRLDDLYEVASLHQRIMGTGVQPGKAST